MEFLKILDLAYQKNFPDLIKKLEDTFNEVEDKMVLKKADNFVFSQDISRLLYNELFTLAYRAFRKKDDDEYILSLKVIYAKLMNGHRYTYFDRTKIANLISEIDNKFELVYTEKSSIVINKNAKSGYDRYPIVDVRVLEMEYKKAMQSDALYKNIIDLDNYINKGNEDKLYYLFLIKYLSGYYLSERHDWNKDLTYDLIELYIKLKNTTTDVEFNKMLKYLVNSTLTIFLQKEEMDLKEIIHYLEQANELSGDDSFIKEIEAYKRKAL